MSRFAYQPFYCEENVFHALATLAVTDTDRYALFVTNPTRAVAMWGQRLAPAGEPVVWDYHVVALSGRPTMVWDLDARAPMPCALDRWLQASFPALALEHARHRPQFRLVAHDALVRSFASDRRHMRDANGAFREPVPPWPALGVGHTLERFLDLEDPIAGEVFRSPGELAARLAATSSGG